MCVRKNVVEGSLHETKRSCGKDEAFEIQAFHQDADTTVYLAEDVLTRDEDVFEDEFAGVGAAHAKFV
jgi:hypothetical protein